MLDNLLKRFSEVAFEPIELTKQEELAILNYLHENFDKTYIDSGSSRAAFEFGNYVVKVAAAQGGANQNMIERNFWAEHGETGFFAPLVACGQMINIMEFLNQTECYDLYGRECYDNADDDEFWDNISFVVGNVNNLTEYDGGDNCQVGFNERLGRWQVYDYGYSNDYERDDIVDSMGDWIERGDIFPIVINSVDTGEILSWEECHATMKGENDIWA